MSEATVTKLTPDSNPEENAQQNEFKELTQAEVDKLEPKERIDYLNNLIQVKQDRVMGSKYPLAMPVGEDDPNNEYGDSTKYYQTIERFFQKEIKWGGHQAISNNRFYQFIEVMNVYDELNSFMSSRKKDDILELDYRMFEILYNLMLVQDGNGYHEAKKYMYMFRPINNSYRKVEAEIREVNELYQTVAQLSSELNPINDVDYAKDDSEYNKSKQESVENSDN